jgi:4-hydroxyphenylpyruvate dioxygenase-like putative hemolysin
MAQFNIFDAVARLRPNDNFGVKDGVLNWEGDPKLKPTDKQIADALELLNAEFKNNEYARNRKKSYPALPEQLDMIYHAIDAGALDKDSDFYKALKAVKDKYPKS